LYLKTIAYCTFAAMEENIQQEWFKEWFNSPYYHLLYSNRDAQEAIFFLDHLISYLNPQKESHMLDLACGRGRHAVYLHSKGFDVTGVDLSKENIRYANQFQENGLQFFEHDMRQLLATNAFDYIFNLFTSFGYFDHDSDNMRVVRNMSQSLSKGGILILDFLNVEKIRTKGFVDEKKQIEGIHFHIQRKISGKKVVKTISINDQNRDFQFEENVTLLTQSDFENYFNICGLEIKAVFGNYRLDPFNLLESDRLIYCVQKP
jgi:2-polyprenyl-3-methyl-5-hydroxy-6-metoxy-1,4-benzoquinol methylase